MHMKKICTWISGSFHTFKQKVIRNNGPKSENTDYCENIFRCSWTAYKLYLDFANLFSGSYRWTIFNLHVQTI